MLLREKLTDIFAITGRILEIFRSNVLFIQTDYMFSSYLKMYTVTVE